MWSPGYIKHPAPLAWRCTHVPEGSRSHVRKELVRVRGCSLLSVPGSRRGSSPGSLRFTPRQVHVAGALLSHLQASLLHPHRARGCRAGYWTSGAVRVAWRNFGYSLRWGRYQFGHKISLCASQKHEVQPSVVG